MRSIVALCGFGFLVSLLLLTGCGSGSQSMNSLTGQWRFPATVPVTTGSTTLNLQQNGSGVSGSGQYQIEAGRSGTLQVSGTTSGTAVNLTFHYDYGATAAFQGQMPDANHLTGTLQPSTGSAYSITFVRQ